MIYNSIVETIGNTPLIRLNNLNKGIEGEILVKVEYFNPGNSMKDRMAVKMVEDAEKAGILKPVPSLKVPVAIPEWDWLLQPYQKGINAFSRWLTSNLKKKSIF